MKLKICGMKYPENILEVSTLLPDYLGFIFWEKSSRYFDLEIPKIPESIKKVGVFVNATLEEILLKIKKYNLNLVQLHGNESPEFCKELKKSTIKIIKVFSVNDDFNFSALEPFEAVCDYFLFDTKGKLPGGNGITFNWQILKKYHSRKPFFLSGGIGLDDIKNIKKLNLPIYAIDVNSKFEIEAGLKNIELLKSFKNNLQTLNL
ncbi:phosphoribosylanthranilate isomerase [Flavobacterium psychrophilum]|uniref:phosphoribosylanthranilate isomerase n=1 Tax=Flavobacterium psychrophilum TaxID=96345 RepID=UPI000B7C3F75|nr:phosphoribosylanthranilate isomerase [Flavobacterium psychrophilum]MCB6000055.1 phosphoribosylanthranilate isomerase [Flavobacterium psychrophilum]MCB6014944.1 phosphoribosylanthranilate isomerase [Flavobacterium psychrophilum]MCB6022347.1 phosphoribosylanthranilate isomerase [Flavobacterium psychrophilum]MCB6032204.1 phosphoribosylanthranilate isomerase [Flavobacterium psychrophilum]MCB6037379.1 phosphoribosylanthranilate isomerase [Flavobacterium psychrophilum]